MTTTREFGCIQVGRVVDGRLGVLGQDGAFGNDGRFHELPPEVEEGRDCALLDGAGRPFIAMSYQGLPASGPVAACVARRPPPGIASHLPKAVARRQAAVPLCPHDDMRILYYGTLGPKAVNVTYDDGGMRRTVATSGPLGAYLVVVRPSHRHPALGYFVPGTSPASGLVAITYRDGHSCRIRNPRALGGARSCPRVGYVAAPSQTATPAQLATRVRARFSSHPIVPRVGPEGKREGPRTWVLTVSFTARVDAGPRSFYFVTLTLPRRSCQDSGGVVSSPIARDIRAGEGVRTTLYVPTKCHGAVNGDVRFQDATDARAPTPFESSNPRHTPVVGDYSAIIPAP
jgi:hypothetical protein